MLARRTLLIGDSPPFAALLRQALREAGHVEARLECVHSAQLGLERLRQRQFDAVLTELVLPDSRDLGNLNVLVAAAADVPVLVFGDAEGRDTLMQVLACGAQDYLVVSDCNVPVLARALNGAIGRKAAQERLFQDRMFPECERARVTLNSIGDAVLCADMAGNVSYLNPVAEKLTGWRLHAAKGLPLAEVFKVIDGRSRASLVQTVLSALVTDQPVTLGADCLLLGRAGGETPIADSVASIHDAAGGVTGVVVVFRDASAARLIAERMSHLARHDFLTDLPNRLLLDERLAHAVKVARRRGGPLAVLFLDLDHLKPVNDTLGHALGDQLLKAVANRLNACVRETDTVSRQGGDEFVVLLTNLQRNEDAARIAHKMRLAVMAPYRIEGHLVHLTVSIGISLFPQDGRDPGDLIRHADLAMYHAKALGGDDVRFFDATMNPPAPEASPGAAPVQPASP